MSELESVSIRRSPGRPNRISRDQIVIAATGLLEHDGLAAFTMGKLARAVGVSVMALYTYYPSRSALLDAVADSIFAEFETPKPGADWEVEIRNWIASVHQGFQRKPIALHLIKWDEHFAPAWMRVWLPMVRVLADQGLAGKRLFFACSWLSGAVMGAVQANFSVVRAEALTALVGRTGLSPADDALLSDVADSHDPDLRSVIFDFEVDNLMNGLRILMERPSNAG